MLGNLKNSVKFFLSTKSISVVIVLIAIGNRLLQLIFFFNIRVDGMYQYVAMQSFVHGNGVSLAEVLPTDLSKPVYEPLINWPPGYSILLSPFYVLFNNNYIAAGLTVDILAAIALILFARKILELFELPKYLINIYTLFSGFFIYNFYFIASSDAIAISLFVIALYLSLLLVKSNSKWVMKTIFISVLLIACAFIKYLFYPVVFVLPIFIFIKGILDKEQILKKAGLFSIILIGFCLVSLLFYQKNINGTATYISQPERGFFPENLSLAYPFIPASIINPESVSRAFGSLKNAEISIFRIFQIVHIISVLGLLTCSIHWIRKNKIRRISLINSFLFLTILIALVITSLLVTLSLSVGKEEINPGIFWSYIEDARYHGLITVLFQMCLFVIIYSLCLSDKKKWKFIFALIFLLFFAEAGRGILFTINRISKINIEKYSWQSELNFQQQVDNIIRNKKKTLNFENTVISGTSYYFNYRVCIYSNAYYLNKLDNINKISELKSSKNILLLYISENSINSDELDYEGNFMNFYIYSKHIKKKN